MLNFTPEMVGWSGVNAVDIAEFLGHHEFHHKKGVLTVKDGDDKIILEIGDILAKNCEGKFFRFVDPRMGDCRPSKEFIDEIQKEGRANDLLAIQALNQPLKN